MAECRKRDAEGPLNVDEIEARADAATVGPWDAVCLYDVSDGTYVDGPCFVHVAEIERPYPAFDSEWQRRIHADARFIAHAREDIPALVAEVRRLRSVVEAYEDAAIERGMYS